MLRARPLAPIFLAALVACALPAASATDGPAATETSARSQPPHQEQQQQQQQEQQVDAPPQDRWSMVASMGAEGQPATAAAAGADAAERARPSAGYAWNVNLDSLGHFQLNWNVNYAANEIAFALELSTNKSHFRPGSDLFGLGFSERGQLAGSDLCLIWFDLSHRVRLVDARVDSARVLRLVERRAGPVCQLEPRTLEEDYFARPGSDNTNDKRRNFEVHFRRPLEVCGEREHFYAIDNGTTHLVWFALAGPALALDGLELGERTGTRGDSQSKAAALQHQDHQPQDAREERHQEQHQGQHQDQHQEQHQDQPESKFQFGLRRVQLVASGAPPVARAGGRGRRAGHLQHEVRMDAFEVPARETTYWCKLFKLPERFERRRFHVTSYEAAIEPAGMERVVHHMELFHCTNSSAHELADLERLHGGPAGGWAGECSAPERPRALSSCRRVLLAWAMGAKPLTYPREAGQPLGGRGASPFVVLEVHYNNVGRARGLRDSSGLRFRYTGRLRPFDAGILEVGLEYTDKNSVPPGLVAPLAGHCVSECTRAAMSAGAGVRRARHQARRRGGRDGRGVRARHHHHRHHRSGRYFEDLDHHEEGEQGDDRYGGDEDEDEEARKDHQEEDDDDDDQGANEENYAHQDQEAGARNNNNSNHNIEEQAEQAERRAQIARGSIFIFAGQLHTHLAGVASWTEVVRAGRLAGELQRDDHYSPHFQEIRLLPRAQRLDPGDALIHYCLYDTRARSNVTLGGFATADEMCVTYLHYYPRIDLEVCKSSVDSDALARYFEQLAREDSPGFRPANGAAALGSNSLSGSDGGGGGGGRANEDDKNRNNRTQGQASGRPLTVAESYRAIEWTPRRSRELIEFYQRAPLSVQCNRSDGRRWPGEWRGQQPTRLAREPARAGAPGARSQASAQSQADEDVLDYYRPPSGRELLAYRGLGHAARHARCERAAAPGR